VDRDAAGLSEGDGLFDLAALEIPLFQHQRKIKATPAPCVGGYAATVT
jgi:hypothetical protein